MQTKNFAGRNKSGNFDEDKIIVAVKKSKSLHGAFKLLGYTEIWQAGLKRLRDIIEKLNLDTSHWIKGARAGSSAHNSDSFLELLVVLKDMPKQKLRAIIPQIKKGLIRKKLKEEKCEICNIENWEGKPLNLTIDHINGIRYDNRIENLRLLCYICHARTPTYKGKNIKNKRRKKTPPLNNQKFLNLLASCIYLIVLQLLKMC